MPECAESAEQMILLRTYQQLPKVEQADELQREAALRQRETRQRQIGRNDQRKNRETQAARSPLAVTMIGPDRRSSHSAQPSRSAASGVVSAIAVMVEGAAGRKVVATGPVAD